MPVALRRRRRNPWTALPSFLVIDLGLVLVPDVVYRTPAYVDAVIAGSSASKAGNVSGRPDRIRQRRIGAVEPALKAILGRLEPGDLIHVVVRRKDQLLPLNSRARPAAQAGSLNA